MVDNPYAAPKTHVEDVTEPPPDGDFVPEGRGVPAGNGWKWIADAWAFMEGQRLTFLGVFLLMWLVQLALNFVPIIGPIATTFLFPFLVGGIVLGCDAVRRGEALEVGHLFAGFQRHTNKLLLLGVVTFAMYIVIAVVMIAILGATVGVAFLTGAPPPDDALAAGMLMTLLLAVLVVLALSVPVTMAILFVPALVVLHDAEVLPALRTSFVACLKNVMPFLVWGVVGFVLSILASLPLLLGWLVVGPLLGVSLYLSYRDIFYQA